MLIDTTKLEAAMKKAGFLPGNQPAPQGQPMDPSQMQGPPQAVPPPGAPPGMPPGDPSQMQAGPPVDPSQMQGPPPSAPVDPSQMAAAGAAPSMLGGIDPQALKDIVREAVSEATGKGGDSGSSKEVSSLRQDFEELKKKVDDLFNTISGQAQAAQQQPPQPKQAPKIAPDSDQTQALSVIQNLKHPGAQ